MRARNLKPGLFKNEVLGNADPLITILFAGLWCMADRKGRLEDRPLRISAELFPYRRAVSEKKVEAMLDWLRRHEFIARYETPQGRFIQVLKFERHQNPHKNERPSVIPALSSLENGASTGAAPEQHDTKTERLGLIPSSLNPDSLNPDTPIPDSPIPDSPTPSSLDPEQRRKTQIRVQMFAAGNRSDSWIADRVGISIEEVRQMRKTG